MVYRLQYLQREEIGGFVVTSAGNTPRWLYVKVDALTVSRFELGVATVDLSDDYPEGSVYLVPEDVNQFPSMIEPTLPKLLAREGGLNNPSDRSARPALLSCDANSQLPLPCAFGVYLCKTAGVGPQPPFAGCCGAHREARQCILKWLILPRRTMPCTLPRCTTVRRLVDIIRVCGC